MSDLRGPLDNEILLRGGDFSIESPLGMGGFGITYRGCDRRLNRIVAIKEFFPYGCVRQGLKMVAGAEWTAEDLKAQKQRFVEEGRTLARLRHPGIPVIYDIFEENETAYLVMEFVEGQTFAQYMEAKNVWCLTPDEAVGLIQGACDALSVVHRAQLLHRDLKPANLMRCPDGQVMLIDFGASHEFMPETVHSQTVVYTAGYAPLEQYSRSGVHGPYSDVYSLSATLYYLLTGQKPLEAPLRAVGHDLQPPTQINPQINAALSQAVMRGLEVRPDMRTGTVDEFLNSLLVAKAALDADPFIDLNQTRVSGNSTGQQGIRSAPNGNAPNGAWAKKSKRKRAVQNAAPDYSMFAPGAAYTPPQQANPAPASQPYQNQPGASPYANPVASVSSIPAASAPASSVPASSVQASSPSQFSGRPAAVVTPSVPPRVTGANLPGVRPSRFKQFMSSAFRIVGSSLGGGVLGGVLGFGLVVAYQNIPHDLVPYNFINRFFYSERLAGNIIKDMALALMMGMGLHSYHKQKRIWRALYKSHLATQVPTKISAWKVLDASLSAGVLTCFWGVLVSADFLSSIRSYDIQNFVMPVVNIFQVILTLTVTALAGTSSYNQQKQLVESHAPLPGGAVGSPRVTN